MCSAGPKIATFPHLFVGLLVCPSLRPHLSCAQYIHVCCCHASLLLRLRTAAMQFVYYTGVATMSSLAQLRVQHAKEQGQCKAD